MISIELCECSLKSTMAAAALEVELGSIDNELIWTSTRADGREGRPCRHSVAAVRVTWRSATTRRG